MIKRLKNTFFKQSVNQSPNTILYSSCFYFNHLDRQKPLYPLFKQQLSASPTLVSFLAPEDESQMISVNAMCHAQLPLNFSEELTYICQHNRFCFIFMNDIQQINAFIAIIKTQATERTQALNIKFMVNTDHIRPEIKPGMSLEADNNSSSIKYNLALYHPDDFVDSATLQTTIEDLIRADLGYPSSSHINIKSARNIFVLPEETYAPF